MTSGIVRRGGRLLRPMGPWSPAVQEYPRHPETAGFKGSPRCWASRTTGRCSPLSTETPRWTRSASPGKEPAPPVCRTDLALRAAADLLRKLPSAAASCQPAVTSYRFHPRPPEAREIISHGGLGPRNTVYRDGIPVAFIDRDSAGPVTPLADLADAARTFVPPAPRGQLLQAGSDPLPDLPARLRMFVDAYGLTDRKAILPALKRSMLAEAADQPRNAVDAAMLYWFR
jgi:aminoglycoside phosphotransferase (APT) family kinase protein